MILLVQCPKCRQKMKYEPRIRSKSKNKKCVYCGSSFVVNRERIVDRIVR